MQISPPVVTFFLCAALAAGAQTGPASPGAGEVGRETGSPTPSSADAANRPNVQVPDLLTLVTRVEAAQRANRARMVPHTVTREYLLFSGADKEPKGTVVAEVRFQPPTTKTWEIKKTSGSGRAEKVVKSVLEQEVNYAKSSKIAITRENYGFRYLGLGETDHRPSYVLQLIPKHDDSSLLRGWIWVDRDTYLIHRFEGEPAKSPSWWIKDLKLSSRYSDLGGIWLPTTSKGVADVRLFGRHTMTERTLTYRAASTVQDGPAAELARLTRSHHRRFYPPSAELGASIIGR